MSYIGDKAKLGNAYEDFIYRIAEVRGNPLTPYTTWEDQKKGENKEGIEIKYASRLDECRGAWFEIAEKTNPEDPWRENSGILRKDNTIWFATGNYDRIWFFPIYHIRGSYNEGPYEIKEIERGTSRGFYMPEKDFPSWKGKCLDLRPYGYLQESNHAD